MNPRRSTNIRSNLSIIPNSKPIDYIGNRDNNGLKTGFGIQKWSNGTIFKGNFKNDRINGWGIVTYSSQNIFKGKFSNDKANGFGIYLFKNGKRKMGYWFNDVLIGIGCEYENDEYFYGEFQNSEKYGLGIVKSQKDDKIIYEGEIKYNNYNGFGIKYYDDGNAYYGNWTNNFKNGYGEYVSFGGQKYIGYFKNDKKDGFGLYYLLKDTYNIGYWENDLLEGIVKCFIGNEYSYSFWKEDKKKKVFKDVNEIRNLKDFNYDKYSVLFGFDIETIRFFFEDDEDSK